MFRLNFYTIFMLLSFGLLNGLVCKADSIDLAFTSCVWQSQWTYYDINQELITRFQPHALFPMHVGVGDEDDYFDPFMNAFQPLLDNGRIILTYNRKGPAYLYRNGQISPYE